MCQGIYFILNVRDYDLDVEYVIFCFVVIQTGGRVFLGEGKDFSLQILCHLTWQQQVRICLITSLLVGAANCTV